jgi:hypothetical protein
MMLIFIEKKKIPLILYWFNALLLLFMVNVQAAPIEAMDNVQLSVTPERCIALHKGQTCYLEVTFNWQHPDVDDYCLVNATSSRVITCWQQEKKGQFSFDFQSTMSNDFALRSKKSGKVHANAKILVAWVYKSSKRAKSTWRLF